MYVIFSYLTNKDSQLGPVTPGICLFITFLRLLRVSQWWRETIMSSCNACGIPVGSNPRPSAVLASEPVALSAHFNDNIGWK